MEVKKLSNLSLWTMLKTLIKYAAYVAIFVECVNLFISKVEDKDGIKNVK